MNFLVKQNFSSPTSLQSRSTILAQVILGPMNIQGDKDNTN